DFDRRVFRFVLRASSAISAREITGRSRIAKAHGRDGYVFARSVIGKNRDEQHVVACARERRREVPAAKARTRVKARVEERGHTNSDDEDAAQAPLSINGAADAARETDGAAAARVTRTATGSASARACKAARRDASSFSQASEGRSVYA